jgi:hypothetical protein
MALFMDATRIYLSGIKVSLSRGLSGEPGGDYIGPEGFHSQIVYNIRVIIIRKVG